MSGRRGRGKAKDSPARGRGRGRGRGKAQANESVEESVVSEPVVSESVGPCSSVSDEAAPNQELVAVNETKISDPVELCTSAPATDDLQSTEEIVETNQESTEPEVKTEKANDVINIDGDAVILTVNVSDGSLEPASSEPEVIELDSDDDEPETANEEKELISSNVDTKQSFEFEVSANEQNICDADEVINLDDDDDDDDESTTVTDEHHFYCTVCDIDCKTERGFANHEQGFYHCQRVKRANEDKTVQGEEEKQGVDAADIEINPENDEEEMDIEMDTGTTEAVELTDEKSKGWITLDQTDEVEGGSDTEEDKGMVASDENACAAEVDEPPEMLMCAAVEDDKEETSGDPDEQTKENVVEDGYCVKDGLENSDNTVMEKSVVPGESSKEVDEDALDKTHSTVPSDGEANDNECDTVGEVDEENGNCDAKDVHSKELNESGCESLENNDENMDGLEESSAGISVDVKTEADEAEDARDAEVAESTEQHEDIEKSNETEEIAAAEDSKEEDDEVVDPYYCVGCDVRCENDKAYHMHTRGMMHTLNCGGSSSAADRPKPVPQVYRVPKTAKGMSRTSVAKKPKESKSAGEGTDNDVILIDDDESDKTEEEEDAEEEEEPSNSKEYNWLEDAADANFYCEVCDCNMTSEQNYESHILGARHKKNLKNRQIGVPVKKPKGKVAYGGHQAKVVDCEPKAQEMINNCKDALIGVQYMTEFCHSSSDVEPRYICNLCEAKCDVRMVIVHLTGLKHRMNYLKKYHTNYAVLVQQRVRKSDQTPLAEEFAKEIEALVGRRKMVVKMDVGGSAAASRLVVRDTKDELETGSRREPRKRRASPERSKSPSRRASSVDDRSLSPDNKQKSERERRRSRSGSRHRDRSPRKWSSRRRSHSRSRSKDRRHSRDRCSYRSDDRSERRKDWRSSERDWRDRDWKHFSPESRRRRSDYNRYEQDSRTDEGLLNAAQALYACGTSYPYAHPAGVALNPYSLVSMNSAYSAALGSATYPMAQRRMGVPPPAAKRSRFSDVSPGSASMSYAAPSLLSLYGSLGAASPYASLYGARDVGPAPQPVPPVTESPLLSGAGYQRSFGSAGGMERGTRVAGGDAFSSLSSIVASVSSGVARDDDEAAAMSKVIAEAVIKYKMQKVREKTRQLPPTDRFQKRY